MGLRRSRRPGRADRPGRPRARGIRSPRRRARLGPARAIGRGAARSGELGDEDTGRGRSMILIHRDTIERAYGNSKPASSSPDQAMDVDRPVACLRGDCAGPRGQPPVADCARQLSRAAVSR
jgi:hypothetical protein